MGGRIVTIGSIFAERVPRPSSAVYAMTKAALAGLTRGLARELGPRGITVNVIQPGPTATDSNPDSVNSPMPCGNSPQSVTTVAPNTLPAPSLT